MYLKLPVYMRNINSTNKFKAKLKKILLQKLLMTFDQFLPYDFHFPNQKIKESKIGMQDIQNRSDGSWGHWGKSNTLSAGWLLLQVHK